MWSAERRRLLFYQAVMFVITYMNYAMLHATRSVWSAGTKDFKTLYGFEHSLIAAMNTCFLAFYGVGGLFTGQLADKYKKGKLIFYLYLGISITVCLLGLLRYVPKESQHKMLPAYFALKIINGALQSPGWAINMVLMSNWFPRTGRGFLLGVWACNTSTGDIIGTQIYKLAATNKENWNYALFIIGALVFLFGVLSLLFLVEKPADLGFDFEEYNQEPLAERLPTKADSQTENNQVQSLSDNGSRLSGSQKPSQADGTYPAAQQNDGVRKGLFSRMRDKLKSDENEGEKKIRFVDAFFIPGIIEFSASMFFGKLVMSSFFYWFPTYLQEQWGYSQSQALDLASLFSAGAVPGNILMGLVSDLLPMRSPVFEAGVLLSALLTFLLGAVPQTSGSVALPVILFLLGGALVGTSIIIAAIECDMGNFVRRTQGKEALGTFAGIIDGIASTGSIFSQLIVVGIESRYGWNTAFNILAVFLIISSLPAISFLVFEIKQWKARKREKERTRLLEAHQNQTQI